MFKKIVKHFLKNKTDETVGWVNHETYEMRFEHEWESNERCDKCKKIIEKNAYFFMHDFSDESPVFCDECYSILQADIYAVVFKYIGKLETPPGVITNDQWVTNLIYKPKE